MKGPAPTLTAPTRAVPASPAGLAPALEGGLLLERYRLKRPLGAGGYGVVWEARDERLERDVAVKVVHRRGDDDRIEREARAAARLGHPGIVALFELVSGGDEVYLVSELVRGRTLADLIAARALADRDVARIGVAICEALEHAHRRGVIHRDVKPQNIMVVAEPAAGAGFAKLTDFGVAHLADAEALTRSGDVVGTLAYMAPEQADGVPVSPAVDVYALALCLYEGWAGSNPVRARGAAATVRRLGKPLPSLANRRRDLPIELCDAVDDALVADPDLRPTPAELAAALRFAEPELSEDGGLVEPHTLDRVGLPAASRPFVAASVGRAAAGLAWGLLVGLALTSLGAEPPVAPLAAAAVAAATCWAFPRIGALLVVLGVCGWLASPSAGQSGTAVLLLAALAPVPFLLPRAGVLWPMGALSPALAAIGLGPAFVGVAALAGTPGRRAGLAVAGFLSLVAVEALTGSGLLFGVPDGLPPRESWQGSAARTASEALWPLVSGPALAPVALWALAAPALRMVVRGRHLAFDACGAAVWAAAMVAGHAALAGMLASTTELDHARGGATGAVVAAGLVLAVAHSRGGILHTNASRPLRGYSDPLA